MKDFIAIDFETANEYPSSVCSIGAVLVRNDEIVKTFYSLIRPEPDYYKWFCQQVHGLGHEDTDGAEVFPFVWRRMTEELLEGVHILSEDTADSPNALPLVAHNASFDSRCLREVFRCYWRTTLSSYSTIRWQLPEDISAAVLRIISCRLWRLHADTTL